MNQSRHHRIDYIELPSLNIEEAKRFYHSAFGWEFTDYGPEYVGIRGEEREMGGIRKESQRSGGSGPLVILYSDDLEKTLAAVKEAGGQITQEPFPFPGGRRFHFLDLSGNELAVWSEA